ncbi:hypothetical protein RCQ53_005281 [Vibrio harveyi]|nr:hypothetical protein [Vibrio harveyi]
MKVEVIDKLGDMYSYLSAKGIVDLCLLGLAVVSANFSAYIYYFDINALSFVDASAIAKHILVISIHYAGALAVVSISILLLQNLMSSRGFMDGAFDSIALPIAGSMFQQTMRFTLWSILEKRALRTTATIILFSAVYIGVVNTLIMACITLIVLFGISYFHLQLLKEKPEADNGEIAELLGGYFTVTIPTAVTDEDIKVELKSYLLAKIGVIALLLALSIGVGRANYIDHKANAVLGGEQPTNVVVITTSSSGLALYDKELKVVVFKPWSKVEGITFPIESQRSIKTLSTE